MKQIYLLFILISFTLSSVIFGSAEFHNAYSNEFITTDDKDKTTEEINTKPKEENKEEKSKDSQKSKESKGDGKKGFGGNRFKHKKNKDKK